MSTGWWLLEFEAGCAVVEAQSEFGARCDGIARRLPLALRARPLALRLIPPPPLRGVLLGQQTLSAIEAIEQADKETRAAARAALARYGRAT